MHVPRSCCSAPPTTFVVRRSSSRLLCYYWWWFQLVVVLSLLLLVPLQSPQSGGGADAFRVQSVAVRGRLMCGQQPARSSLVKLFDEDDGSFATNNDL